MSTVAPPLKLLEPPPRISVPPELLESLALNPQATCIVSCLRRASIFECMEQLCFELLLDPPLQLRTMCLLLVDMSLVPAHAAAHAEVMTTPSPFGVTGPHSTLVSELCEVLVSVAEGFAFLASLGTLGTLAPHTVVARCHAQHNRVANLTFRLELKNNKS